MIPWIKVSDILYAEGDTSSNGFACVVFLFPQSECGNEYNTTDQQIVQLVIKNDHERLQGSIDMEGPTAQNKLSPKIIITIIII